MNLKTYMALMIALSACEGRQSSAVGVASWSFAPGHVNVPELPRCPARIVDSADAEQSLQRVWVLGEQFGRDASTQVLSVPSWGSTDYAEQLARVVSESPGSTAALSARFEIALILAGSAEPTQRERSRYLLAELASKHGAHWQGTLASATLLRDQIREDVSILSGVGTEFDELVAGLKGLQEKTPDGLVRWMNHRFASPSFDFCARFYQTIVHRALEQDDLLTAQKFGERLVHEYPDYWYTPQVKLKLDAIKQGRDPNRRPPLKY